jgi:hypothetical protein
MRRISKRLPRLMLPRRTLPPRVRAQRGAALIFTLLALCVLSVLGLGITSLGMVSLRTSGNERETNEVLAIADAGVGHARRLMLWQEWGSFNQFLQRGNGTGCDGDELGGAPLAAPSPPFTPLPANFPTAANDFIPAAGHAFGTGRYVVRMCDETTELDPATNLPNTNVNDDVNRRILVRSTGFGRNDSSATIEAVFGPTETPAVLVNGDLEIKGNPEVKGDQGGIHANGDLLLTGNPCAETAYSSVDEIQDGSNAEGGPNCTNAAADTRPHSDPINLPLLTPLMYKEQATYWLTSNGKIMHKPMGPTGAWVEINPIPNGSLFAHWNKSPAQNSDWTTNGEVPPGTYYAEASVNIAGNLAMTNPANPSGPKIPLPLTILTEGHYKVTGNPLTAPHLTVPWRGPISVIAAGDVNLGASMSNPASGLYYARHQLDVAGGPTITGQLVALNELDIPLPVGANQTANTNPVRRNPTGSMELTGGPTIIYDGNGLFTARMLSWRECRDLAPGDPNGPCGTP